MYPEEVYEKMHAWAEQGLLLMRQLLPKMAPIAGHSEWTDDERNTIACILSACARSTESALLLIAYGQLWDAEVLVRSVAEGSLKFCYMLQNMDAFPERHRQYSHDLFRIALLKDHKKVTELLSALGDPKGPEWEPMRGRVLSEVEVEEISGCYPRHQRAALDSKWGFTGLMGELKRSGDPMFGNVAVLAHGYAIASHVQHVDYIGASLPFDRDTRSAKRKDSMHLAHAIRLISDVFTSFFIRMTIGYRFVQQDSEPLAEVWERIQELERSFGPAYEDWINVEYPEA